MFVIGLYEDGYAYGTIENFKVALLQAFGSACEDKLIAENPFRFTLSKVIPKEEKEKAILTEEQYERLRSFEKNSMSDNAICSNCWIRKICRRLKRIL